MEDDILGFLSCDDVADFVAGVDDFLVFDDAAAEASLLLPPVLPLEGVLVDALPVALPLTRPVVVMVVLLDDPAISLTSSNTSQQRHQGWFCTSLK